VLSQKKLLFTKESAEGLIEIFESNKLRYLTIDTIEQTRIKLSRPDQLASPLHPYFLSSLLFTETPKHVLLGGLGGGAIARYLYNKQPEIKGKAIEISKTIATLAEQYFYFPNKQWNITINDLKDGVEGCYDLMIIDIAHGNLTPDWLYSETMLLQLKNQLSCSGVLVINLLVTDAKSFSQVLVEIRKAFAGRTLCSSIPNHKNIVVYAFNQHPQYCSKQILHARVSKLTHIWGLDFSKLLAQLEQDNPDNSGIF